MALLLLLLGGVPTQGQTTGRINGHVVDPSGAAVAGAGIRVIHLGTSVTRTATTDEHGLYTVTLLPVGRYAVEVSAQGFKTSRQENLDLQVESDLRADFRLEIGDVSEQVIVADEPPLVDASTTTLGKVVEQKRIVELPLNGRNFLQLGVLQAGVTPPPAGVAATGSGTDASPGGTSFQFSVNGLRVSSNNHLLDGTNNVEAMTGATIIVPSPDTIAEFKILTNAYSAEHGRGGGSIVTVLTRSGTNEYHGTVYEFLRNDVFDARNFFAPDVPPLKQNQFGVTFGGPIVREKAFIFGGYEGFRQRRGRPTSTLVPSLALRQGDFSGLPESNRPIDPQTGQRFPNDQIPLDRQHPISLNILDLYPLPNQGDDIWTATPVSANDRDQFLVRYDQSLLDGKNTFTARYIYDRGDLESPNGLFGQTQGRIAVPGFGFADTSRAHNLLIADTHTFGPRFLNEFRFAFVRADIGSGKELGTVTPADVGFTYPVPDENQAFPPIGIPPFSGLGYPILGNDRDTKTWQFADNVVVTAQNHTFKFGVDVRYYDIYSKFPSTNFGSFNFLGFVTGNPYADFLLGRASFFLQTGGDDEKHLSKTDTYLYVQDDWRVSPRVTLNLGVRYELAPGFKERDDLLFTLVPGVKSVVGPTLPTGLVRPGDPGVRRAIIRTDKNNFGPRVGIAWDVFGDGRTSLRAGYGIFYDDSSLLQTVTLMAPPDRQGFFFIFLPDNFADPFNGNSPLTPPIEYPLPVLPGFPTTYLDPELKLGYVQQWNLTAQRQLTDALALEVAYVGTRGVSLNGNVNQNQPVLTPDATRENVQARRPFPELGPTFTIISGFDSYYHGFQSTLTHRLAHGLSLQASYTWAKAIDNTSTPSTFYNVVGQPTEVGNALDIRNDRGLSAFDIRHRFVTSFIYELPFFAEQENFASYLLGGWRLSGIVSAQSGMPFTVLDRSDQSYDNSSGDRPNVLRDPNDGPKTPEEWFDTGAFVRAPGPVLNGNAGRNIVFTDGVINTDMGLAKTFRLGERSNVEFRWEVFNLFNHANFGVPDNDLNSPGFGRIQYTSTPERIMQFGLKVNF